MTFKNISPVQKVENISKLANYENTFYVPRDDISIVTLFQSIAKLYFFLEQPENEIVAP